MVLHSSRQPPASSLQPLLIALTGGIASGKSAVADLFARREVPVLDTDQIARELVEPGSRVLEKLTNEFGAEILNEAGELKRVRLRERVFNDPAQRQLLESIMHPAIRDELAQRSKLAGGAYQIHVIPLLVETGRVEDYDRVLLVDCPESMQIDRLIARDGFDNELANRILSAQATREQRLASADDVIVNTGTLEDLNAFVETLHKNYSLLAQRLNRPTPSARPSPTKGGG